jgi:uncharacterized protein with FMN-binding domain/ferredoxin
VRYEEEFKVEKLKKRRITQGLFLILAIFITINHTLLEKGVGGIEWLQSSYLHYVCPICGITSLFDLFGSGMPILQVLASPITFIAGGVIIIAIFLGPLFCGWACPFGAYQDFVAIIGKKIFGNKYNTFLSKFKIDKYLRYIRYIVLIFVIYFAATLNMTILEKINPYHSLLNLFVGQVVISALMVLILITIGSLFIQRPWCKYLCPYGAFLGLFNKIKIFKIFRNKNTCVGCKKCTRSCPMNIDVSNKESVNDLQCISCMECTSKNNCPIKNTVKLSNGEESEQKMIKKQLILGTTAGLAIGSILTATGMSIFNKTDVNAATTNTTNENTPIFNDSQNGNQGTIPQQGTEGQGKSRGKEHKSVSNTPIETIDIQAGKYKDGTYTGTGTGYSTGLKVQVVIASGKISDVKVVSNNETPRFAATPIKQIPAAIISAQSTNVSTVSGATMTSRGIIEATNNALKGAQS